MHVSVSASIEHSVVVCAYGCERKVHDRTARRRSVISGIYLHVRLIVRMLEEEYKSHSCQFLHERLIIPRL